MTTRNHGTRIVLIAAGAVQLALAQMGGGMMGGSAAGSPMGGEIPGNVMGSGAPGMIIGGTAGMMGTGGIMGAGAMMGGFAAMMNGGPGLATGPDGTVYVTRRVAQPASGQVAQSINTEIAAITSAGKVSWTVPVTGTRASQPALGKDGRLFVTMSGIGNGTVAGNPQLLIVTPSATSSATSVTVQLVGDVASAPQIAEDAGSYVVYVVTIDMPDTATMFGVNQTTGLATYLQAFTPSGTLKFRMQLN